MHYLDYIRIDAASRKCRGGWQGSYPGGCYRKGQVKGAKATAASKLKVANKIRKKKGMAELPEGSNTLGRGKLTGKTPAAERGGALAISSGEIAQRIKNEKSGAGKSKGAGRKRLESDQFLSDNPGPGAIRDWINTRLKELTDPSMAKGLVKQDWFEGDGSLDGLEPDEKRAAIDKASPEELWGKRFDNRVKHRNGLGGVYKPEHTGLVGVFGTSQKDVDKAKKSADNAKKRVQSGKTTKAKAAKAQAKYEKLKAAFEKDNASAQRVADRWNKELDMGREAHVAAGVKNFSKATREKESEMRTLSANLAKGQARAKVTAIEDYLIPTLSRAEDQGMLGVDYQSAPDPQKARILMDGAKVAMQEAYTSGEGSELSLGLPKGEPVTRAALKKAYRKRAVETHPDQGGSREEFESTKRTYEALKRKYRFDSLPKPSYYFAA